jgi:hypothetical protein
VFTETINVGILWERGLDTKVLWFKNKGKAGSVE